METQSTDKRVDLSKLWPVGVFLAVIGLAGLVVLSGADKHHLWGSYIFGFVFWMSITLGCFGLSLLHHATRGSWSVSVLRLFESGGGWQSLLLMAALFLPIAFGGGHELYEWMHLDEVQKDPILQHKQGYLNETFWLGRIAFYFIIWIVWALIMRRSTIAQDESKDFRHEARRGSGGAAGLVMFFLTVTFALLDWVMSMNPHWYSTMYGAWLIVGSGYGALALVTAIVCHNAEKEPYRSIVSPYLTKDLGNMLFVLTMLWGYTTLSQFIIIWNGNIPETTTFYKVRSATYPPGMEGNYWAFVGFILIVGMFFIPFYSLITPRTKKVPSLLKKIAIWMFCMAIINIFLIVVPSVPERANLGPVNPSWLVTDILAFIGVGGAWLAIFSWMSTKAPLVPLYDTRLQEAKAHAH
ncbi:MAG: hypothetical protein ACAH95_13525 [Fimbriimonas sp.]